MEMPHLVFRTGEIAELAQVEPRRVERLLESENVFLDGIAQRPDEKKHRRFSMIDGFRVELILALNELGVVPAKAASGLVEKIVNPLPAFTNEPNIPQFEKEKIVFSVLGSSHAHVWFDEKAEQWTYASYWDRRDGSREFFGTQESARQMADNSRDVYIVVNLARMATNYLERLDKLVKKISAEQGVKE